MGFICFWSCLSLTRQRIPYLTPLVFISYYLNARFVFREKLRLSKAMQYPIVYLAQYLIGLGSLYLLIEVAHLSKFFAPIVIVVITVPCTYLLSRYVIKGRSRRSRRR